MNKDNRAGSEHRRRAWWWIGVSALIALAVLAGVMEVLVHRAGPILKGRVIETLSTRFDSKVELDMLSVSLVHGLQVSGAGLRIFPPDDVIAAGASHPLIAVAHFTFNAGVVGLLIKPMHVRSVHVSGLQIDIPPREMREQGAKGEKHRGKIKIVADEIVCDDSRLILGTAKPGKEPKIFALQHIVLHDVGPEAAWPYDAILVNAVPQGEIHSVGHFGPWNNESPGDSSLDGRYTFDHANLNPIKGIGGILSSSGDFNGRLNKIEVEGTTETPNFSLDTAQHPMPLHTEFQATVDGTSGDTYLHNIRAKLGDSEFSCQGAVINVKGKGHIIDLDVEAPAARIEDFLALAVNTRPAIMTGTIDIKAKLHIPPGKESVSQKLAMKGDFVITGIHFTNPEVEDKVDMLSLRAQGEPKRARAGAPDVRSRMAGRFVKKGRELRFSDLNFTLPAAAVELSGVYSLDGRRFDFRGKVRTRAELSQMVSSRWKSWLLKLADPFFKKHGAGAEIPVRITGTKSAPKFGLDLFHGKHAPDSMQRRKG